MWYVVNTPNIATDHESGRQPYPRLPPIVPQKDGRTFANKNPVLNEIHKRRDLQATNGQERAPNPSAKTVMFFGNAIENEPPSF